MQIIVVEDDHFQAELIAVQLRSEFDRAGVQIISTEADFRARLIEFEQKPPDLIVMDVMLRWADPSPDLPAAPEDVRREGFHRAGLRCVRLLQAGDRTRRIPVIVHTVVERDDLQEEMDDLPKHVVLLTKSGERAALVGAARNLMKEI